MVDHETSADIVLELLGVGRWQITQVVMLTLFYLSWATQGLGILILGFVPDFACLPPDTELKDVPSNQSFNVSYSQSCVWRNITTNTSEACDGTFVYAEPKESSIVSECGHSPGAKDSCEGAAYKCASHSSFLLLTYQSTATKMVGWDLVCGSTFLSELSQTIHTVGLSVGTLIFTPIADMYGRRNVVLWCHVVYLAVSLLNCLATDITTFIVARFFLGVFLGASSMVGWVITLEIFLPRHRTLAALITNVFWSASTCLLPALGYMMKGYDWRYVQLAMSGLSVVIVGQFLFVDEPLRWLMANEKHKEAIRLVRKAGRKNRVHARTIASIISRYFPEKDKGNDMKSIEMGPKEEKTTQTTPRVLGKSEGRAQRKVTVMALVKHPKLRRVTLVLFLAWFTNSLTYYGLYMVSSVMSGDRYLNLFFSSVAEFAASIIVFPIILKCGRRRVLITLHLLAGVSLIAAAVLHTTTGGKTGYIALTCVTMLGKVAISGTYCVIFLYTPEVYPTNIRAFGVGAASLATRIGGLLAPFASTLAREVPWAPVAVFGGCCMLVALACPLLPETKWKDLPQTLWDLEKLFMPDKKTPKQKPNVVLKDIKY